MKFYINLPKFKEPIEINSNIDTKLLFEQFLKPALNSAAFNKGDLIEISLEGMSSIFIRPNTTDFEVMHEVLIKEAYSLDLKFQPKFIVDAGANVGFSSVYFQHRYPGAKIFSVEPEGANFDLLKKNTNYSNDITQIKAGLWNKEIYLNVKNTGQGEWAFTVEESLDKNDNSIKAITISNILRDFKFDRIDILKMDIEGAEKEVFSKGYENWLGKVKVLIIETHEDYKKGCRDAFYNAIKNFDFVRGSKPWMWINQDL